MRIDAGSSTPRTRTRDSTQSRIDRPSNSGTSYISTSAKSSSSEASTKTVVGRVVAMR